MLTLVTIAALVAGCGGGGGGGTSSALPSIVTITAPADGATVSGNVPVTATLSTTSGVTGVVFKVNGVKFDTADAAANVAGRLDTLSMGLGNGPQTITIETTGYVTSQSSAITVNNGWCAYVQDAYGSAGGDVVVHVRLNKVSQTVGAVTTEAAGCHIVLNFDQTKLQLDAASVAKGPAVPAGSTFTKDTSVPGTLEATITGNTAFTTASGCEVLTAVFTILAPSAAGTKNDITFSTAELSDTAAAPIVPFTGLAGRITTE